MTCELALNCLISKRTTTHSSDSKDPKSLGYINLNKWDGVFQVLFPLTVTVPGIPAAAAALRGLVKFLKS